MGGAGANRRGLLSCLVTSVWNYLLLLALIVMPVEIKNLREVYISPLIRLSTEEGFFEALEISHSPPTKQVVEHSSPKQEDVLFLEERNETTGRAEVGDDICRTRFFRDWQRIFSPDQAPALLNGITLFIRDTTYEQVRGFCTSHTKRSTKPEINKWFQEIVRRKVTELLQKDPKYFQ